jgi:hypothetical protein
MPSPDEFGLAADIPGRSTMDRDELAATVRPHRRRHAASSRLSTE